MIIVPDINNPGELSRVAAALLDAADDPHDVKMETFGSGPYFVVPDEVAAKAKLNPEEPKTEEKPKAKKRKDS